MITITNQAKKQLEALEINNLRVAILGQGCSGLSYDIQAIGDDDITTKDKIYDHGTFMIVIDPKSSLYLNDVTMDFSGGLQGRGFTFEKPSATRVCGCSKSFSA